MVQKIKIAVLSLFFLVLVLINCLHKCPIETNIVKTLLPQNTNNSANITNILNKSSSVIKIIFEGNSDNEVNELKNKFLDKIDKEYFNYENSNYSALINKYLSNPMNFLSDADYELLKNKKYDEIYEKSIDELYSPMSIQLTSFEKDPYLLCDNFISSLIKMKNSDDTNKIYDYLILKINNNEGLSPKLSNKKIYELIKIKKQLSNDAKIYLAGTPIHSYYSSQKSIIDINIICIISTLLIIFLTYFYFKSFKLLLPILISTLFGMLLGVTMVRMLFNNFQVITFVFSTTLIGIGIDYSYHYFFNEVLSKKFIKNLSFSLITTIVPFVLLYLSKIELLKQISVFMIFGLFGIYLVVLFIYPMFKINKPVKSSVINENIYKIILILLIIIGFFGIFKINFNDSLTALYTPDKKLIKAENLFSKISPDNFQDAQIIVVNANNNNELIKKEEEITKKLKNTNYISLSKLIPSIEKQKDNFNLVKKLYISNLDNYSDILSKKQIDNLKNKKFTPVDFDINKYGFLNNFILSDNTSLIFVFENKKLNVDKVINVKKDISQYMEKYRKILMKLLPVSLIILYFILLILYNFKKAFKILLPSLIGVVLSSLICSFIYKELNLFSVITLFLLIGFTIDYSIFRIKRENKTEDAIFASFITTSSSFLMLTFCGFKLLSTMAVILFFGILTSYLSGYFIFLKQK